MIVKVACLILYLGVVQGQNTQREAEGYKLQEPAVIPNEIFPNRNIPRVPNIPNNIFSKTYLSSVPDPKDVQNAYGTPQSVQDLGRLNVQKPSNFFVQEPEQYFETTGPEKVYGTPESKKVYGIPESKKIYGTPEPKKVYGTPRPDVIFQEPNQFIYPDTETPKRGQKFYPEQQTPKPRDSIKIYETTPQPMKGMPYDFQWEVRDEENSNIYNHIESSDGAVTTGEYRVLLPDGRLQIVTFIDRGRGYEAEVTYEDYAKSLKL